MYPSSSSSSSHCSMTPSSGGGGGGLTRYGSAPGSILTTAVDSVIGPNLGTQVGPTRFFSTESSSSLLTDQSTCKPTATRPTTIDPTTGERNGGGGGGSASNTAGSQRSYCLNEFATAFNDLKSRNGGGGSSSSSPGLVRHRSSPADFLDALTDKGFPKGIGSYNPKGNSDTHVCGISRLNSQLSFTRQDSLSQISEESENAINGIGADGHRKASHSYTAASFGMGSWDDTNMFPSPQSKRAKNSSNDIANGLNIVESQLQFGPSQSALEMAAMESLMEIPQDSVPCKIRAKRGCATHPRSIAERERRTRISGKLKKLQDLVPNMDKQTSYADMLDLAVQHIKGLQTQVQNLNHELESCTCGCKQTT